MSQTEIEEQVPQRSEDNSRGHAIFEVVFNIGFLWLVNNVPNWDLQFVKASYSGVLWALNVAIGTSIIGNGLLIIANPEWFYRLVKTLTSATSVVSALMLWAVFPFDFSASVGTWLNRFGKVFFLIVTIGSGVGTVVNGLKLVGGAVADVFGFGRKARGRRRQTTRNPTEEDW